MFVGRWYRLGGPRQVFRPRHGYSEFWKGHLRRSICLPGIRPPLYDSGGIRFPDVGGTELRQCPCQRQHLAAKYAVMVLMAAAMLAGCHSSKTADPGATWQSIHEDFLHGNLDVARKRAVEARSEYSAGNPEWGTRFRLLEAEILIYQGPRPDVITLLNSPGVSYPVVGDDAIKRNLLCVWAHSGLGQAQQADLELQQARRLSDASHSRLNDEVLLTEALVQNGRDHLAEAARLFGESLKIASEDRDSLVEASDLLNLGFLDLRQEHYDEALTRLSEAVDCARPVQAQQLIQV